MQIINITNNYYVLIKLSNYDNLYKLETNHSLYPNENKILIRKFKLYDYYNNELPIYIINVKYNNILKLYTCSLLYSYNYQITIINQQTQLCKLEYSHITNNDTYHILEYQIATSVFNKTKLELYNLFFDENNKYFTANIISNSNNFFPQNNFFINGNKLNNNKISYTIKEKKHLYDDIYEARIVNDSNNT